MDLRTQLLRMGIRGAAAPAHPEPPTGGEDPPLEELVEGRWELLPDGRCFVAERRYAPHESGLALADLAAVPPQCWAPFAAGADEAGFDPCQALLLDIETTGLARGAGTCAFMVGVGLFTEGGLLVRQYFMPDYGDEGALLDLLAADLRARTGLITFNGRAFDWPILEARYVLARRALPSDGRPHLDLLPLARRLWRHAIPSCALSQLEGDVLGIRREGLDVPSYLIPQLYQDYVRWGRTRPMAGVFYHNAMDVFAMAALTARMGQALRTLPGAEGAACWDYAALGALYEGAGRVEEAIDAYRLAIARADNAEQSALAHKRLSFLLKRLGRHDEAAQLWRARAAGGEIYPYIELAKHLEHRQRDYAEAARVIREAMAWVQRHSALLGRVESRRLLGELEHRLTRVERRGARGGEGGSSG